MRTAAVRDGDEWIINGAKQWISNAGVADVYVVFAVTDREQGRATAFLVEADRPGFSIGGSSTSSGFAVRRPARRVSTTCACRPRT